MYFPSNLTTLASRPARIIGLLVLSAVLAACSAVKLGYNNLDDIAYWWLDSYVDFADDQATRVREDLVRLHRWHRAQELPQVVELLRAIEQLAPGDVTPAQTCALVERVTERLNTLAERAEPALAAMAMSLAPEQLLHLERKYQKNVAEFRKEWMRPTASELLEKRFDQSIERSEMIYGKLDDLQRAVLRREIQRSMFDPQRALADRQRRQRDALQTLRKIAGQSLSITQARSLMHDLLDRVRVPPEAVDRSYQQALIDEGCRTIAALHNSTTAAQREIAVRRLRAYQRDFSELSTQK